MITLTLKTFGLLFIFMIGWWWLALPATLYLAWRDSVLPAVFIAVMMDAYEGRFFTVPVLSIGAILVVAVVSLIKSRSLLYNKDNAVV
jgi:hypothetical protein